MTPSFTYLTPEQCAEIRKTFTEGENRFLDVLVALLYAEAGFTDVDIADMAHNLKVEPNVAKGFLGSLVKRGVLYTERYTSFGNPAHDLISIRSEWTAIHPAWWEEIQETEF